MAKVINGKKLAQEKEKKLKKEIEAFKQEHKIAPKLASIITGDDRASHLYLSLKEKAAKRVGISFEKKVFSSGVEEEKIYQYINSINRNHKIHGIVIQMPLPKKLDPFWLVSKIDPEKDVDCLTPENLGLLMLGRPIFLPATVKAVLEILARVYRIVILQPIPDRNRLTPRDFSFLRGRKVVVVGAGDFVGKPLAVHLKSLGATVALCDEYTKDLKIWTKKGEILVSATGVPNLIKKEMIKKGAVVIDVGSPHGDVVFEKVKKIASFITPVPGGVGPLTVACLLENVLLAARHHVGLASPPF